MSPLLLADWREINRVFCAVMWIVALVLVVVILGHNSQVASGCLARTTHAGASCPAAVPRPHLR